MKIFAEPTRAAETRVREYAYNMQKKTVAKHKRGEYDVQMSVRRGTRGDRGGASDSDNDRSEDLCIAIARPKVIPRSPPSIHLFLFVVESN